MANSSRRSTSTAAASSKSSRRPPSRASTESMQSSHSQVLHLPAQGQFSHVQGSNLAQPTNGGQPQTVYSSVEAALLQSAHSLTNPDNLPLDPALPGLGNSMDNHQYSQAVHHGNLVNSANPYDHLHSQEFSGVSQPTTAAIPSGTETEDKKKKGSASSATNDKELRQLLANNDGRSLKEVAAEVIATERTPRAEKTKQLFAMLWLRAVCKWAKTSVPRNRVYSHYARRCGTERVVPLNPASFGKLVRVIFPNINTRRLGVRGESKYHYVHLALVEEDEEGADSERAPIGLGIDHSRSHESVGSQIDFSSMPRLPAETALFPAQDQPAETQSRTYPTAAPSVGRVFTDPDVAGIRTRDNVSTMYDQTLKFPPMEQEPFSEDDHIQLPDIYGYCPPRTDIDAADALSALYRTHCTSLIDCIRFCKEKQFFRLFTSFHGTLTVPVQKLFAHPSIAPWIKECDWLMYQKMVRFVSQLTLQVAPPVVLKFLASISRNLHMHINRTFQGHATHVLEAKLEPATLFAGLLHRMLRANSAAHAAAALLMIDQTRDQMWHDWVSFVNPKRIIESEIPGCGFEEVYQILTHEVRTLLQPLNTPASLERNTHYQDAAMAAQLLGTRPDVSNETVIDRLATFLNFLPMRFPNTDTRTLLHCISALGTAALREITVENGLSYQPWWITKVFIDEMSLWLASMGGFLDHRPSLPVTPGFEENDQGALHQGLNSIGSGEVGHNDLSQFQNVTGDFAANDRLGSHTDVVMGGNGHTVPEMHNQAYQNPFDQSNSHPSFGLDVSAEPVEDYQNHDDSGIGMSLVDEETTHHSKLDMAATHANTNATNLDMRLG